MMLEKVMEEGHYSVRSFTYVRRFVDEVIDLAWYTLTTHSKYSKYCTLSEIHRPRLEWVVRVMDLRGKVE